MDELCVGSMFRAVSAHIFRTCFCKQSSFRCCLLTHESHSHLPALACIYTRKVFVPAAPKIHASMFLHFLHIPSLEMSRRGAKIREQRIAMFVPYRL